MAEAATQTGRSTDVVSGSMPGQGSPPPPPPPGPYGNYGGQPPTGDNPPPRASWWKRKWLKLPAWLWIVAVIVVIAAVANSSNKDSSTTDSPSTTGSVSTTGSPSTTAQPQGDGPAPTDPGAGSPESTKPQPESADLTQLVVDSGFSSDVSSLGTQRTSAGAAITNPTAQTACGAKLQLNLLDGAGNPLDTVSESIEIIPAGATVLVSPLLIGHGLTEAPASLRAEIVSVDKFINSTSIADCSRFNLTDGVFLTVASEEIQLDRVGIAYVRGQVTNPTDQLVERAFLDCVFRADGAIVGGESTAILDPITPGGTIAFSTLSSFIPDGTDAVQCQIVA